MMGFWPWGVIPIREKELKELTEKAEMTTVAFSTRDAAISRALKAEDKLEAVREFVLSRRYDIERDIENFGMLKPVLSYFLEEAEDS